MRIEIKNKAQVETLLGKPMLNLVTSILKASGEKFKSLPWVITFHNKKPAFALHDFQTLDAYVVNLETMTMCGERYCGSGVSTINHMGEQLSEGNLIPEGFALLFITSSYNSSGNAWKLDVVSQNITKQIEK